MEATHVVVVLAPKPFALEAAAAWDSVMTLVKDVEDRAALSEREVQEMESSMEMESAMMLASVHKDAEGLVRNIVLLEGGIAEVRRAPKVVEESSHGLFDAE
jgi:hypothetical protein